MAQVQTAVLSRVDARAILLALTLAAALAPLFRVQLLAGTIVNASLVLALLALGRKKAMAVALFPSVIAVITGVLPSPLVWLVPFIVAGNITLIMVFDFFKSRGFLTAALAASLAKFAFLSLAGNLFLGFAVSPLVQRGLLPVISYIQLATAILGCLTAYLILKTSKSV